MATKTSTIRVPSETRDLLAIQAKERGISVSALLTAIARGGRHEALFSAERAATIADAADPAIRAEDDEWAATLEDGI